VIVRRVLIDSRRQAWQLAADQIQLQVVPRTRAARGTKLDLTPGRASPALEHTIRAKAEPGHRAQIRDRLRNLELARSRQGIKRGQV
jgi:hypothetical protein